MILVEIPVFHSVKTVGDGDIQSLGVDCICSDTSNAMNLTRPIIIRESMVLQRKH